jgi:acetyltransferase-like isoleucine patch superfamily enzyme
MKYIALGNCIIHSKTQICSGAVIGKPYRKFLDGTQEKSLITKISKDVYIGYYAIIGTGSRIAMGTIVDDHCIIESRVRVGQKSLITYRAQICNDVKIGDKCIIGGFIGERTIIGNNCRIFGNIVHLHHNPSLGWDDDEATEGAPVIKNHACIGFGAIVTGNITIGRKSYICAGAIVTRNVPDLHVVSGKNKIVHYSKWKGRLRKSPFFKDNDNNE